MTDKQPPTYEEMRARIRQIHAQRGRKIEAGTEAMAEQFLAFGSDVSDDLIKAALNMRAHLEVGNAEEAVQMAHNMVKALEILKQHELICIIRELVIRVTRDLLKDYETLADFKEALLAGKVQGYDAKTPEERDLDLLSMSPEEA